VCVFLEFKKWIKRYYSSVLLLFFVLSVCLVLCCIIISTELVSDGWMDLQWRCQEFSFGELSWERGSAPVGSGGEAPVRAGAKVPKKLKQFAEIVYQSVSRRGWAAFCGYLAPQVHAWLRHALCTCGVGILYYVGLLLFIRGVRFVGYVCRSSSSEVKPGAACTRCETDAVWCDDGLCRGQPQLSLTVMAWHVLW